MQGTFKRVRACFGAGVPAERCQRQREEAWDFRPDAALDRRVWALFVKGRSVLGIARLCGISRARARWIIRRRAALAKQR
jgi:hypothetical protein